MAQVLEDREHFVQFYESDEFLLGSLGGYVGAGLAGGEACVVVATGARRAGLDAHLRARGHDTRAARMRGQFFSLDAAETLSSLMVGGSPEPSRFEEVVGQLIELHGGTVKAESEGQGKGSTFTIRLPLADAARRVERAASGRPRRVR